MKWSMSANVLEGSCLIVVVPAFFCSPLSLSLYFIRFFFPVGKIVRESDACERQDAHSLPAYQAKNSLFMIFIEEFLT